jgi:hypothetical protein
MWTFRLSTKLAIVGLALSLIAAAQEVPWRYAVKPGDSRAQVVQIYGEPKSAARTGNREVLLYPEGRVVLQDGKLVELHFTQAEPRFVYAQDRAANPPEPAPTAAPSTPAPASVSVTPPEPSHPLSPPPDWFSPPVRLVIGGVVLVLGFLLWLKNRLAQEFAVTSLRTSPATGDFAPEVLEYATGKNLHLLTGGQFVERINALPSGPRTKLLAEAFKGDWRTPTCPRCGVKMVLRPEAQPYWSCANYPRCRSSYAVRVVRPKG